MENDKTLTSENLSKLLDKLQIRFEANISRHPRLVWKDLESKLLSRPDKLQVLSNMENTSGEPDLVGQDEQSGEFIFFDCSKESPKDRRSLCYDRKALLERKKYPPKNNVEDMATDIGIELLSEAQYRHLQQLGSFDTTTSSWIKTPGTIRELGGALFGDFRYDSVFIYHNAADSYYSSRGFRGCLKI